MEIIDYEIELINNLYDRHKLYNNINHKNLNEYYIFNYIRYIKKTHDLIKTKQLSKKTYNEKESDKQEPDKQEPDKQEPNKQEPNKQEPNKQEPDKQEPNKQEPNKQEPEPEPESEPEQEPEKKEPEPEKKEPEPEKKEPEPEKKEPEPKQDPKPKQSYKQIDIDYRDKYIIKIYKKCLMKCHPDKTKINFRNKLFLLLQKSYENEEFYIIILIANYLNININIQDKNTKVYDFFLNYIIHKYNVYK